MVKQLRENHPVHVLRPEGKEHPTRTVHRNNLRPFPLNMVQDNQEPTIEKSPGNGPAESAAPTHLVASGFNDDYRTADNIGTATSGRTT